MKAPMSERVQGLLEDPVLADELADAILVLRQYPAPKKSVFGQDEPDPT